MHDPEGVLDLSYTWDGKTVRSRPTWQVLARGDLAEVVANQMWSALHREERDVLDAREDQLFEEACSPGLTATRIREIDLERERLEKQINELTYVPTTGGS